MRSSYTERGDPKLRKLGIYFVWILVCLSVTAWGQVRAACDPTAHTTVGSGAVLRMLVFGDSAAWGNGAREARPNEPGRKFSAIVADEIATQARRQVDRIVYAHSAAMLVAPSNVSDNHQYWPGSVNSAFPLIADQLRCPQESDRAGVDLLLVNGCINDVGAFEIVNPSRDQAWLRKRTVEFCRGEMETVMRDATKLYPRATIVVVGYYPIISDQSDIAAFLDFLREFFPQQNSLSTTALTAMQGQPKATTQLEAALQLRGGSATNSELFYDLSNQLLAEGVDHVNAELSGLRRVKFAKVPFGPENSFGAPKSYLWPIPTIFSGFDEEYLDRQIPCVQAFSTDIAGLETCRVDSTAHPNLEGSRAIATAIMGVLSGTF